MKRTPFYAIHERLGAKLVEFAGFAMPVQYTGIIEEHLAVRRRVGLFDVSHMGEFEVRGNDALALIQKVTTNDASKLPPGKVQYSALCYEDGGIVDDLLVYNLGDRFMLVVNASNTAKDFAWIASQTGSLDVELTDRSDDISLLALQGPKSLATLEKLTSADLPSMAYYTSVETEVAGIKTVLSRTGYTGELGFELYFDSSTTSAETVWGALTETGREYGLQPVGLGARDTLRLEMGFCLYGNDIDRSTNPLEAGLGWITKLEKGSFIGRDALLKVKQEGIKRRLVGFLVEEQKAFPRHGYEIRSHGETAGQVTSGTFSPVLEQGIGMGYVRAELASVGSSVDVVIRAKEIRSRVVNIPFIRK